MVYLLRTCNCILTVFGIVVTLTWHSFEEIIYGKLENVAINDVLPVKAARHDAIANLNCFWASDTKDLISMVTFTFTMWRHLIWLVSAPFISSRLATFGWVQFPCATREKHNAEFTEGG